MQKTQKIKTLFDGKVAPPQSLDQLIGHNQLSSLDHHFDHTAQTDRKHSAYNVAPASAADYTAAIQGKMTPTTKKNPCEHCGDHGWCMRGTMRDLCNTSDVPAIGWEACGSSQDGGVYFRRIRSNDFVRHSPGQVSVTKFYIPSTQVLSKATNELQDIEYRKILDRSTLTPDMVETLSLRNLSPQEIEEAASKGWVGCWHDGRGFSPKVYGVDVDGNIIAKSGLFISAMRGGQILGGQTMPTSHVLHKVGKGAKPEIGKYLALGGKSAKSNLSPKTIDTKEIPLTSYADGTPDTVYIVEGYLKAMVLWFSLRRTGRTDFMVVGTVGSQWGLEELRVHLAAADNPDIEIVMLPDGGAISNPHVIGGISKAAHNLGVLGYQMKIGWWGQIQKGGTDPDEISIAVFEGMKKTFWQYSEFGQLIEQHLERFNLIPIKIESFQSRRTENYRVAECSNSGELADLINSAPLGTLVINQMATGSGKSHAVVSYEGSVYLITNDPHNPATPEIGRKFQKTPSRSGDRWLHPSELNGAGFPKNESKDNGGELIPATCIRSHEAPIIYSSAIETSLCTGCSFVGNCDHLISKNKLRHSTHQIMHPNSLPAPSTESAELLKDITLVIDDVNVFLPKKFTISLPRLRVVVCHISSKSFISEQTKTFFRALLLMCERAKGFKYGIDPWTASKLLPDYKNLPIEDISYIQRFENELKLEYEGREVRVDVGHKKVNENGKIEFVQGTHKAWEQRLIGAAAELNRAEAIEKAFSEGGIGSTINALFYSSNTVFSATTDGDLVLSRSDERIVHAINAAKVVVINDATGRSPGLYQTTLGFQNQRIVLVKSPPSASTNVNFTNVIGLPRLQNLDKYGSRSHDRVNDSIYSIVAEAGRVKGFGKVGCFCPGWIAQHHRKLLEEAGVLVGSQFHDSRGSNSFQGCTDLYILGNFKINRIAAAIEFTLIFHRNIDTSIDPANHPDIEWREFYKDLQVAEILQALGRFRAGRRYGETLNYHQMAALPENIIKELRIKCPGVTFGSEHGCDYEGWIPSDTQTNQIKLVHSLMGGDLNNPVNMSQMAEDAGVTRDVARGFFERLGEKSTRKAKLLELKELSMWHMNSIALGLPPLTIYDPADLDCYISEPTKAAIQNDLDARGKGMANFFRAKNALFGVATEVFAPLHPDKFAQIFLGTPPPIEELPDWGMEMPIAAIPDQVTSQNSGTSDPPIN